MSQTHALTLLTHITHNIHTQHSHMHNIHTDTHTRTHIFEHQTHPFQANTQEIMFVMCFGFNMCVTHATTKHNHETNKKSQTSPPTRRAGKIQKKV